MTNARTVINNKFRGILIIAFANIATAGIAETEKIRIGQSIGTTGAAAEISKDITNGLNAAFTEINKSGGIRGKQIELIVEDDGFDPTRTGENTAKFQKRGNILALAAPLGTHQTSEMLSVLLVDPMPLICPFTGGESTRIFDRNIFHIRASYHDEVKTMVQQLITLGQNRIGILYQDDALGREGLGILEDILNIQNLRLSAAVPFSRNQPNVKKSVDELSHANLDGLIIFSLGQPVIDFIKLYKSNGQHAQIMTLSTNATNSFIGALGKSARGVVNTQVVPNPWHDSIPIVKAYQQAIRRIGGVNFSHTSLEGYICGKVIIEGLKRSGSDPTREKFIRALDNIGTYNLGGFEIKYSPRNHNGSTYVDMTVINSNGKMMQ
jgi:ABC-type branched-subunit amino acid transport system substrate-binding protein